jgi:uncharacterized cupin superfamily protein
LQLNSSASRPRAGIAVTAPRRLQANGLYHAELLQEAFLVLSGECRLLVEGGERLLRPWDSSIV